PYALCPAASDVAEYCERLVREVLVAGEPDGLILEGAGPMGFAHQGVHEKTSGADYDPDLMSLCFCASCSPRYPADTRARVRTALDNPPSVADSPLRPDAGSPHRPSADSPHRPAADSRLQPRADSQLRPGTGSPLRTDTDSPLRPVEAALGPLADEVRALRVELSATLRRRLIAAARDIAPDLPITLHANPDPWATGPFAALPSGEPGADV